MGGKTKKIDTSGLTNAAMDGQAAMLGLGQRQLDFAQQQYDQLSPLYQQMAQQQMGLQNGYNEQAGAQNRMYNSTFLPMIEEYANKARNFNSDAFQQQLAQQASDDAAAAFGVTQEANTRNMASMGVNPNSGRFAGTQNANAVQLAAQRGAAMTNTRAAARAEGDRLSANAIGMGDGLRNAGIQSAQMAMNAGNNAGNLLMAPSQLMQNAYASQGNMMQSGYQHGMAGLQSGLNIQQQNAMNKANERGQLYSGIGTLMGTVGGVMTGGLGYAAGAALMSKYGATPAPSSVTPAGVK